MATSPLPEVAAVVPDVQPVKLARNPISRKRVEAIISRSVAVFGIVFGAQTLPAFFAQAPEAHPVWLAVMATSVFLSLILAGVLSIAQRGVRTGHAAVSLLYLIALISWPFAVLDVDAVSPGNHWLYYLLTVATATAAIGFSTALATAYLFVVPIIYGVIRSTPAGGGATWQQCLLDSIYAIILGGAVVLIVTMLRQAASAVDAAQATALERYAHAVRQHATEVERVQVDSIVHDSVLTTFISAARAFTPEAKALASTMAGNAIGHLKRAALVGPDDGSTVRLSTVARRIADASAAMSAAYELRTRKIGSASMPVNAAEAVYSASVQAMVNSLQHAGQEGPVSRWITIRGSALDGIEVEVGDTGAGFTIEDVPIQRLGVRVSIIERVSAAGGIAEIDSAANEGTVITIRWPRLPRDEPGAGAATGLSDSGANR